MIPEEKTDEEWIKEIKKIAKSWEYVYLSCIFRFIEKGGGDDDFCYVMDKIMGVNNEFSDKVSGFLEQEEKAKFKELCHFIETKKRNPLREPGNWTGMVKQENYQRYRILRWKWNKPFLLNASYLWFSIMFQYVLGNNPERCKIFDEKICKSIEKNINKYHKNH